MTRGGDRPTGMTHKLVRDLFVRSAIHAVVAAVFFAPLATVGLGSAVDVASLAVVVDDEPEGEPFGDARFLSLPAPVEGAGEAEGAEEAADEADATELEPVLPAKAEAEHSTEEGGSAPRIVEDGGPEAVAAGEGSTEGAGEGEARGDDRGKKRPGAGRTAKGRKKNCEKPHPNVRKAADGTVEIDRALVDHYTDNLESFMKLGYSRPYDEGDVHGWYVSGFSCTSPVSKAGFERGDVLLSVNGKKTRSWVGVFMLYQKLKKKDDFTVELVREGQPVTLRFRVVDGGTFAG